MTSTPARSGMPQHFGIRITDANKDRLVGELDVDDRHLNNCGHVHGGNRRLTQELHEIVENDRFPFSLSRSHLRCSPRIRTLRAILAKLRPEPVREPLPPLKVYALPSKGRYRSLAKPGSRPRKIA